MYKKIVKRGGEEYTYYYHNCRIDGKVKNICLGNDLDEAREKIKKIGQNINSGHGAKLHHNKTLQKFWSQSGGSSIRLQNHKESANPYKSFEKELKPKQIPKEVEGRKDKNIFVKVIIAVLVIAFSLGFMYFFNNSGLTGFAVHDDNVVMEVNKDVSENAYVWFNIDEKDYNKSIESYGNRNANGSFYVGNIQIGITDFGINGNNLSEGEHKWTAWVNDGGVIVNGIVKTGSIIIENKNDNPILSPIGELNLTQGSYFFYDANATDEEDGGEDTGNLTFFLNETRLFDISASTGQFNMTPANSHVGTHYINISVNDSQGGIASEVVGLSVFSIQDISTTPPELPIIPPFEEPKSCTNEDTIPQNSLYPKKLTMEKDRSCDMFFDCGEDYYTGAPYCSTNRTMSMIDRVKYSCSSEFICEKYQVQTINQICPGDETCCNGRCGNWGNVSNVTMPSNITLPSNGTEIPATTLDEGVNILEKIVVGKPVKIMESVTANSTGDMIITIPEDADVFNVSKTEKDKKVSDIIDEVILIDKVSNGETKLNDAKKEEGMMLTGSVVADQNRESYALKIINALSQFFGDLFSSGSAFTPTGMVVGNETFVEENVKKINHKFSDITTENTSLKINNVQEGEVVDVYYELPGPEMNEKEIGIGFKNITISSEFHYENVTAFYSMMDPREPNVQRTFKLYHVVNGTKTPVEYITHDSDFNGIVEEIEWVVPHLSSEEYELEINVLNPQSYPMVGGNWDVGFNTTGVANLTISAVDGTTYDEMMNGDNQTTNDLGMGSLQCGGREIFNREKGVYEDNVELVLSDNTTIKAGDAVGRSLNVSSLRIENYSCNETGLWSVNVITSGKHYQRLDFGELTAYAQNSAAGWWNSTFQKCMNITINNINGTTLTNFPALINLSYDATDMNPDYSDIRFVGANCENYGSLLNYEMDNYTSGANGGNAYYWVNIPSLAATGASISVYYKNSSAVSSAENKTGVWDEYYLTVYHFSAGGGSLPIGSMVNDSTKNGFNATVSSTTIVAGKNSGVIGGALWFDTGWSYLNMSTHAGYAPNRTGTIEMFINRSWANADTNNYYIAGGGRDTSNFYEFLWQGAATQFWARVWMSGLDGTTTVANTLIPQFTYTSWATAWTNGSIASGGGAYTYADGLFSNLDNQGNAWAGVPLYWNIGTGWYKPTSANGFKGTMDEVRYSSIARSNQWINQTVQMMKAPSAYVAFGDEKSSSRCNLDADCGAGFECISSYCFAKNGRFVIQNSSGTNLTIIDKYGNMAFRGPFTYCNGEADAGSFQIKNKTGDAIYWISPTNGSLCAMPGTTASAWKPMEGIFSMNAGGAMTCGEGNGSSGTKHSLRIQNNTDNVTCFSDEGGDGWIYTAGVYLTNVGNDM